MLLLCAPFCCRSQFEAKGNISPLYIFIRPWAGSSSTAFYSSCLKRSTSKQKKQISREKPLLSACCKNMMNISCFLVRIYLLKVNFPFIVVVSWETFGTANSKRGWKKSRSRAPHWKGKKLVRETQKFTFRFETFFFLVFVFLILKQ